MPILAYVHRSNLGDCTNHGVSSRYDQLLVINAGGPFKPFDYESDAHCVLIEQHHPKIVRAVPCDRFGVVRPGWFMAGGNFLHASDSRFSKAVEDILGHRFYGAVAIHDRQE